MSVLKSQRGESTVQFLDTARELEIYTIKTCAKFPKRYMFLITKTLSRLRRRFTTTRRRQIAFTLQRQTTHDCAVNM